MITTYIYMIYVYVQIAPSKTFFLSSRTEDLLELLRKDWQGPELFLVSRLDHPTSGVLPLALGKEGSREANWLQAQFAGRLVEKAVDGNQEVDHIIISLIYRIYDPYMYIYAIIICLL